MHNKPFNQKKAILIASFGTSMKSAQKAIDNLADKVRESFPDCDLFISYTSNIIREKIAKERNEIIPTPLQALANLQEQGYTDVYVAPMHILPGMEYEDLKSAVCAFAHIQGKYSFHCLRIGKPFLCDIPACDTMADILVKRFSEEISEKKTIVLMGHGTPNHISHALYTQLQLALNKKTHGRFVIGTVEATPSIEDVVSMLRHRQVEEIVLSPFMIVAGDHATNDMSDPEAEDSWYSVLQDAGYNKISLRLEGLGEDDGIAELFTERVREIVTKRRAH